jgi:hypothetical protein
MPPRVPKVRFPDAFKRPIFEAAPTVEGRDPTRWRYDAAGTPVMHQLYGNKGLCGWEMDHIDPHGGNDITNCHMLQATTNTRKSNKLLDMMELRAKANKVQLGPEQMDFAEMVVHGNVRDERGKQRYSAVMSKEQATGHVPIWAKRDKIYNLDERICPKRTTCQEAAKKLHSMMSKEAEEDQKEAEEDQKEGEDGVLESRQCNK